MAGMRKSNKKKVLKKKDGDRNLQFPSCRPDVQAALRETSCTEWQKWMFFNSGVVLTGAEVRQLTEAGCEIYPLKWVDTDKNAYLRGDKDCAKYKSRLVGCGNFRDGRTPLRFSSWRCGFAQYRLQLVRTAEGIPEEGIAGGEILASRVPAHGTKDAGRGLWLRLKNTCKQFKHIFN